MHAANGEESELWKSAMRAELDILSQLKCWEEE